MAKKAVFLFFFCLGMAVFFMFFVKTTMAYDYLPSDDAVCNPLMGFAPSADNPDRYPDSSLVYIDITWRELEPEEGAFNWQEIEASNYMDKWREEGKHAVLRFLCDIPSDEAHRDIPDWLYEKTGGDGTTYNMDYGQGYSPDYRNEIFIACHEKAVREMGKRYGNDTFISYVQLGSLGHWGEWHVKYDAGIDRIPGKEIRERYIRPYVKAFPNARILMRRPFDEVAQYGFGIYNDMAGEAHSTEEWLKWIKQGGVYDQTGESCLSAVPEIWNQAPVGGEFTSSISMEQLLSTELETTISLLQDSHTTFLGPKIPRSYHEGQLLKGTEAVLKALGYRYRISHMEIRKSLLRNNAEVRLTWYNDGTAPLYWDWPVYLYRLNNDESVTDKVPVKISLTQLTGGTSLETRTVIPLNMVSAEKGSLGIGIEDPMTGKPSVKLMMETERIGEISILLPVIR